MYFFLKILDYDQMSRRLRRSTSCHNTKGVFGCTCNLQSNMSAEDNVIEDFVVLFSFHAED